MTEAHVWTTCPEFLHNSDWLRLKHATVIPLPQQLHQSYRVLAPKIFRVFGICWEKWMKLGWILKMQTAPLRAGKKLVCFQRSEAAGFDTTKPLCVVSYLGQQRTSLPCKCLWSYDLTEDNNAYNFTTVSTSTLQNTARYAKITVAVTTAVPTINSNNHQTMSGSRRK